ncbi:MAG: hypothetical protein OEW00_08165 [candidate division Zixibacteria bacterium]|nr:hypothetical protein [candidate division Zixibacteria bacterium]
MLKKLFAGVFGIILGTAIVMFAGCAGDEGERNPGIVQQMVDSVATVFAENIVHARLAANQTEAASRGGQEDEVQDGPRFSEINDFLLVDGRLYATYHGGVLILDVKSGHLTDVYNGEKLNAVVSHNLKVYVGGDNLYTLTDSTLEPVDIELEGVVKELCSFNYQLLIGTEGGLFTNSIFGNDLLMDDVSVTAMVADDAGVWVGTDGQGLYRWDGVDFRKRYLSRDPSLFDHVNALDFKHDHLYAGTGNGLHIFDGGRWQTLTVEDGLPADNVLDIDASDWVVYIATDSGTVSCFNYDLMPVAKLDKTVAEVLLVKDRKIYAGTRDQGILVKSGPVLKTLVEPDAKETVEVIASALH